VKECCQLTGQQEYKFATTNEAKGPAKPKLIGLPSSAAPIIKAVILETLNRA